MVKAIFFDIDGTLISKKNPHLTPSLKKALEILRQKGIRLFIASGRHYLEMEELGLMDAFTFDGYVSLNGCYCYAGDQVIHKVTIDKANIKTIVDFFKSNNEACIFIEQHAIYTNRTNSAIQKVQESIYSSVPDIMANDRPLQQEILQVIPIVSEQDGREMFEQLTNCTITRWHDNAVDIISAHGGKEKGIQKILDYYGIDQKDTMAFGDGENDIEMLRYVNIGIAMENGKETTKTHSDFITRHVDENGIIYALKHFGIL